MDMPILDRIFSTPASIAARKRSWASELTRSPVSASSASAATVCRARRGHTASAPKPSSAATAWVSRASSAATTRLVSERRQFGDEALVHGAEGEQDGIGARSAVGGAGVEHEMPAPPATSVSPEAASRFDRGAQALGPVGDGEAGVDAADGEGAAGRGQQRLDRRGVEEERLERRAAGRRRAPSSSSGERGPSSVRRLITRRSRRGSIGGLVTWAKRWRR